MDSDITVIAKRSPGVNLVLSLFVIGVAVAFSASSIHDGFDTTARPWMERRLWMWWLSAYALAPATVVMLIVNFWRLARNGFVAISLSGSHLSVFGVTRRNFALEDLVAVKVKRGILVFMLGNGSEIQAGLLGLVGGTDTLVERIRVLKPEIRIG